MAYQALYRTWRPQKFSDMIGQEVVTKTLKNAIMTGQTTHAYLFNGPRGTGKTSAAKIFAKAINCLNPINGEPDGVCAMCQAADNGTLGDIIELDAASNNGVDEIREIREDVNYAPTQAKYKVYIIDEVHMLSTGAFNALLKTLEEPPANVIFILATTEPQKIPATIISRTQRFDFKRIDAKAAYDRMTYILDQRGDTYDEAAIRVIANAADGGMRDALSILDQALSFGDGHVTLENALLVTGSVTQTLLGEYVQAVVKQDTKQALAKLSEVLSAGKDANRFVEDLISYARDLLLHTEAPELISIVPDETFTDLAANTQANVWYRMIDILNDTQQQLRFTNRPSIYLEVLTVKLSQPMATTAPVTVERVSAPQVVADPTPTAPKPAPAPVASAAPVVETPTQPATQPEPVASAAPAEQPATTAPTRVAPRVADDQSAVFGVLSAATRGDLDRVQTVWADMVNMLPVPQQAMLNVAKPIAASPDGLVVAFDFEVIKANAMRNAELLHTMVTQIRLLTQAQNERQLVFVTTDDWPKMRAAFVAQRQGTAATPSVQQQVPQQVAAAVDDDLASLTAMDDQTEAAGPEPVVAEAERLFGADIVEEIDD
ncbi:DNA polymerase III subunit gamma/tau [Weissella confusa]|uniref:DNA-directed DNA polymerase n=1 Tax=Weissella confusa TaxID=1583 RepID=A0A4Z0RP07_WEICO|nr:DNA polymerase III subunit gamma/tau [Weissella confusa]COI19862.1 DNA polymerase III subunits gamma and tau [Streptococcus pneumoniae]MBJ7616324.1 DNA polymerase III subunit gamma/tau [Weissella confusa]MBJ7625724.1 DNA polymerase III subunit gamma/tau [Weissella confusa]MBJ7632602.1 DNA polymerase III subunit gamma/tau [Weissella confusa]MBJ7638421.1 DNA polymerase III subunit gamma/tau [Weissella confusa]